MSAANSVPFIVGSEVTDTIGIDVDIDDYEEEIGVNDTIQADDKNVLQGDINDDGYVDVTDIVITANYVLSGAYVAIADINDDGLIDVSDIVALANIVLNGGGSASNSRRLKTNINN